MSRAFPLVKRTVQKIADGGPNIPLWNLISFFGEVIHRISTPDVNQFKANVQALAIHGMFLVFNILRVYQQTLKNTLHNDVWGWDTKKMIGDI